jgi:hypothetical protein
MVTMIQEIRFVRVIANKDINGKLGKIDNFQ